MANCAFILFVSLSLILPLNTAFAEPDRKYLSELIAESRHLQLAEHPMWRKLGHYVPNILLPGVHGLVDSPLFYNSPTGKFDPQAELEATLASFYSDKEENNEQQNPQCLFIARFSWLNQQLNFDQNRLPRHGCTRFDTWHSKLNPGGLTLIFASAYLNSPSSMYGHTLLRVDAKDQNEHTRLLAYAINFAADTNESNGLMFAVNGLFGGYPGAFSILPYYVKVREYSDLESRDLWEYQLILNAEEIDMVLMHAWELGSAYFQYYFFDENCSYQLLGLLQVARPELDLTGKFKWGAIPADTVREVTKHEGLLRKVVYRPSNASTIKLQLKQLTNQERKLSKMLADQSLQVSDPALSALPEERAAAVLEVSQDYLSFLRADGNKSHVGLESQALQLLRARSRLNTVSQSQAVPIPETRPDQGHGSSRVAFGIGHKEGRSFQELQGRATYHDIMDSDKGYVHGAQIEFFGLSLRHYDNQLPRVEKFTPVNILSLSPRDDFFSSISWKVSAGWQRERIPGGDEPMVFFLDGGSGRTWSIGKDSSLSYILFEGSTKLHHRLTDGYALGAGVSAGELVDLLPDWRIHGYVRILRYAAGQIDTQTIIGLEQRISLGNDRAIRLDFARNRQLHQSNNNFTLSLQEYF